MRRCCSNPARPRRKWDFVARKRHTLRLRRRKLKLRQFKLARSAFGLPSSKRKRTWTRSSCADPRRTEKRRQLRESVVTFEGHNVRGLQSEGKREELMERMRERKIDVCAIQETWIVGQHDDTYQHYRLLLHGGVRSDNGGRNKGGVGLMLNADAAQAFTDGGCDIRFYGNRLMAAVLLWKDGRGREVKQVVASGYAPIGAAAEEDREAFLDSLDSCERDFGIEYELYISVDANASMGTRRDNTDRVLGPHGVDYTNDAGFDLHTKLAMLGWCAPTTFFDKKQHATWFSIRNGKPFQIDHWLVRRRDLRRVVDCGLASPSVSSDHPRPLRIKARVAWTLARREPRINRRARVQRSELGVEIKVNAFIDAAALLLTDKENDDTTTLSEKLSQALATAAQQTLAANDKQGPDWFERSRPAIMAQATRRNEALQQHLAAKASLFKFTNRATPADQEKTNQLRRAVRRTHHQLRVERRAVKKEVLGAKERAFLRVAREVNKKGNAGVWTGVQQIKGGIHKLWEAAPRMLRRADGRGRCKTERENKIELGRHFQQVLNIDYGFDPTVLDEVQQRPIWDGTDEAHPNLDHCPNRRELRATVRTLSSGKATGDSKVFAELIKAFITAASDEDEACIADKANVRTARDWVQQLRQRQPPPNIEDIAAAERNVVRAEDAALHAIHNANGIRRTTARQLEDALLQTVIDFWNTGQCDDAWLSLRLKTMPKKQPADTANKFRGIYLTDIIAKLLHKMFEQRLQCILNRYGLEEQNGFTPGRGTADGTFALRQCILKAREHRTPVWIAFLDLVKAFPSNSRAAMWGCLAKFGVPPQLLARIEALHTNMSAKYEVEAGDDQELPNTSGCIQGSCLASPTFNVVIQCAMEVARAKGNIRGIDFFTATEQAQGVEDGRGIVGANWHRKSGRSPLNFWVSLYADDAAETETSRRRLQVSLNDTVNTLARFGLKVHLADAADGASKTECMVCLPPGVPYDSVDTSPLRVDRGWTSFTRSFTYLGSLITDDGCDDRAVDARITKAAAVFGALRKELFGNKRIADFVKTTVWESLVGAVLLFGAEGWCLSARAMGKLIRFQRRCVRTMCGVTRFQTWKKHTTSQHLADRLGITSVETLYARKALAWLGHVARMPYERLCKRMAFAWMNKARKRGGQMLNWGHTMLGESRGLVKRAGDAAGGDERRKLGLLDRHDRDKWKKEWYFAAQDRAVWTKVIQAVAFDA